MRKLIRSIRKSAAKNAAKLAVAAGVCAVTGAVKVSAAAAAVADITELADSAKLTFDAVLVPGLVISGTMLAVAVGIKLFKRIAH